MTYSTGDIARITIGEFERSSGCFHPSTGKLMLIVRLDDGNEYRGSVTIDADDYKYDLIEDVNYELGHKKKVKMEDMRDILLDANYDHEDLKEFGNHVNGDDFSLPF